jgi:hypothetical protein
VKNKKRKSSKNKKKLKGGVIPPKTSGTKYDSGKPRMSLVSPVAIIKLAEVMTDGEKKYSANNWRLGFDWTRIVDAAQRHINIWNAGGDLDPDSKRSNLAHAMACIMMLLEFEETKSGIDDRYKLSPELIAKLYPPKESLQTILKSIKNAK